MASRTAKKKRVKAVKESAKKKRVKAVKESAKKKRVKAVSLKKVAPVSDSNKALKKEIKAMSKIFVDNQKILVSMKGMIDSLTSTSNLTGELNAIKTTINAISSKASKIDSLSEAIEGIKQQFETITTSSKVDSADSPSVESIKELGGKMDKINTEIRALSQRVESTTFVGEGLKSVQVDFLDFKQKVFDKTNSIEQKIFSISDILKRQDVSATEFHEKSEKLFEEIQAAKSATDTTSGDSSKEMMLLLKLSEYQSNIRINSETKYGNSKDLEKMASQTAKIISLFDKISSETAVGERTPLPHEIRQWAVSKILDCADKWEIRFSDVCSILINAIGTDMLKETIRIQQIKNIYGIRGVDEVKKELNIIS